MESPQMIFLLGGHDLEMAEISRILNECGIEFMDHGLEWNNAISSTNSKITNQKANSDGGDEVSLKYRATQLTYNLLTK